MLKVVLLLLPDEACDVSRFDANKQFAPIRAETKTGAKQMKIELQHQELCIGALMNV